MESFQKKFIVEATELIQELENSLLALENTPSDNSLIEQVFRVMHSLKGSGAMFGFEKISEFTHRLESIYDFVRDGKSPVTQQLLTLTLKSVDHLRLLLQIQGDLSDDFQQTHDSFIDEISDVLVKLESSQKALDNQTTKSVFDENLDNLDKNASKTFYINFNPNVLLFDNGTNPLYLIDEISFLGTAIVVAHMDKVPTVAQLVPFHCFTSWEIVLATTVTKNEIADVFLFIEDDCLIEIVEISNKNLTDNKAFIDKFVSNANRGICNLRGIIEIAENTNLQDNITVKKENLKVDNDDKDKKESAKKYIRENTISTIRVSSDKLDNLMNLVSELVTTQARLSLFAEKSLNTELLTVAEDMQKLSRQLRDNAFEICLIPIESMLTRFKRLVRDLSSDTNKDIDFITEGTETELDKTIIESLVEPIMHIIRNSIDHGIESTQERIKRGKPKRGKITLNAYYSGASVVLQISDDGSGIDAKSIFNKAVAKGIIASDAIMTDSEIFALIFTPGLSTAKVVTGLSGRGVGMDVVKRKIDEIRGEVDVSSKIGVGTTITIKLPLTLSIIDGLLVKIGETNFIIPLSIVNKIYESEHNYIENSFNNIIVFDGKQLPFLYLREEFKIKDKLPKFEQVIIVNFNDKLMGLVVDMVIGEYQAVLKPLGKHYKKQEIISGATILGDGTVALVLDTNKIIREFSNNKKEVLL